MQGYSLYISMGAHTFQIHLDIDMDAIQKYLDTDMYLDTDLDTGRKKASR